MYLFLTTPLVHSNVDSTYILEVLKYNIGILLFNVRYETFFWFNEKLMLKKQGCILVCDLENMKMVSRSISWVT